MSGFEGFKGRLTFDKGIVRIIREDAPEDILMECENLASKHKVLGVEIQKRTFMNFGHVAMIVDPGETAFKVGNALSCPPNLVLINNPKQLAAAQPVVAEIQAALEGGNEVYYVNLDPSDVPAPALEKHSASPEWQGRAQSIKKTLLETQKDGFSFFIISVSTPEFPDGVFFQGNFPTPTKIYLELSQPEAPPYNDEIIAAIKKAGWEGPFNSPGMFTKTVAWDEEDAINVANFLANTLQWCLFLDVTSVTLDHEITQDS